MLQTCEELIRQRVPNLLRLYLNPWVAQTCVALAEAVRWCFPSVAGPRYPSFLANSGDEALSGAIKLVRFHQQHRPLADTRRLTEEILLVGDDWPIAFAAIETPHAEESDSSGAAGLIPDVRRVAADVAAAVLAESSVAAAGVVIGVESLKQPRVVPALQEFQQRGGLVVVRVFSGDLLAVGEGGGELVPDIVVFDDSMTAGEVPFGAFSARRELYLPWMRGKYSMFHSTTFQPNTISTRHFVRCLEWRLPDLFATLRDEFQSLLRDSGTLGRTFGELFSPSLLRVIRAARLDDEDVTALGAYVTAGRRRLFDGIGGVACSLRGHNPPSWGAELRGLRSVNPAVELAEKLQALTGLEHFVPAVSGASAVESAIRMALTISYPRTHLLVMRGGYAGKTLVALAGTERRWYRDGLGGLYPYVIYLDPFAADAAAELRRTMEKFPVAAIQLELIQGVGGVREVPTNVLMELQAASEQFDVPLIVDEIQTGMHRTGPFVRSATTPLRPDFIAIGKGTSDMMFPCALTLYSDRIQKQLCERGSRLPDYLQSRFGYETATRCILNSLQRWEQVPITKSVLDAGQLYREQLAESLRGMSVVREIRGFGLLIGIELNLRRSLLRRLGLKPAQLYLLRMMQDAQFPLLMGYCQYEPQTLKFTPPLNVQPEEISASVRTIRNALACSQAELLVRGLCSAWRR